MPAFSAVICAPASARSLPTRARAAIARSAAPRRANPLLNLPIDFSGARHAHDRHCTRPASRPRGAEPPSEWCHPAGCSPAGFRTNDNARAPAGWAESAHLRVPFGRVRTHCARLPANRHLARRVSRGVALRALGRRSYARQLRARTFDSFRCGRVTLRPDLLVPCAWMV